MFLRQTVPNFFQSNRGPMSSTGPQQRDHFAKDNDARFRASGGVFRFGDGLAEKPRELVPVGQLVYQNTGESLLRVEGGIAARPGEGSNIQTTRPELQRQSTTVCASGDHNRGFTFCECV